MPSLTFVLPHWVYWLGLVLFPLTAMTLVRRQRGRTPDTRASLPIALMLLVTGGFIGLHRFYLKSRLGLIFIPLFLAILYSNIQERQARDLDSDANRQVVLAEIKLEQLEKATKSNPAAAEDSITEAKEGLDILREKLAATRTTRDRWNNRAGAIAIAIGLLLLLDAILLPRLVRRCRAREVGADRAREPAAPLTVEVPQITEDPAARIHTRFTDAIDATNEWVGNFIAFWSIIAVFVYYYEVVARYVFNSPTNWAHEGMFLMFGMQYLVAGSYAMLTESHVRVDIFYASFSDRGKAITNLLTSVFFFIFAGTLIWTGWIFAMDSVRQNEVSFTEWGIQYWPVKLVIVLGGVLLFLQGLSKISKDIALVIAPKAPEQEATNGS